MTFLNRIQRRWTINRAVRELSRLDDTMLADVGLIRGNLRETVEQMIDTKSSLANRAHPVRMAHNYHVTSGAAA